MSEETQSSPRNQRDLKDAGGLFVRGLAMGAADVVPGVSGGTIAFITGIYARFIAALASLSPAFLGELARGRVKEAWQRLQAFHWSVLIPIGLGVAVAVISLSKLITGLMIDAPGPTYAFFFGLILASIYLPFARMKRKGPTQIATLLLATVGAWLVVGLQPDGLDARVARADADPAAVLYAGKIRQVADVTAVQTLRDQEAPGTPIAIFDPKGILSKAGATLPEGAQLFTEKEALHAWLETEPRLVVLEENRASLLWIFCCGLIAISAMVLPGLSGSFLLLFLGQYHAVFSALHQCLGHVLGALGRPANPVTALTEHAWLGDFLFMGVFGLGVLLGLATFSRVVEQLFERAHDVTMAALAGLMIGALRLPGDMIWKDVDAGHSGWGIILGVGLVGVVIVGALSWVDQRRNARLQA